jgi:hypothetical protein
VAQGIIHFLGSVGRMDDTHTLRVVALAFRPRATFLRL